MDANAALLPLLLGGTGLAVGAWTWHLSRNGRRPTGPSVIPVPWRPHCRAIQEFLAGKGITAVPREMRSASRWVSLSFVTGPIDVGQMEKQVDNLAYALGQRSCLIRARGGQLTVGLPNPSRTTLIWRDLMQSRGLRVQRPYVWLGETPWGEPVRVRLDSSCPHLLVTGQSGKGKTETLRTIVRNILEWDPPPRLFVFDPKDRRHAQFPELHSCPSACVVSTVDTASHHLAGFVGQLDHQDFPETVLIIDEGQDVTQDTKALGYLETLARQGRDAGAHVVLAIPLFVRERIPSAMLRTDVSTQAIFHGQFGGWTNLTGTGGLGGVRPGELLNAGDAWLQADGKLRRLQVALTTDLEQAVRETRFARPANRLPADLHPLACEYWESKEEGDPTMSIAGLRRFVNTKAQHGDKWDHPFAARQWKIMESRGMVDRDSDRRPGWKVVPRQEEQHGEV